jgi:cephalosporin hydroxylase
MINADLGHVTTLEEFYSEIRKQQEAAHGNDYCQQHDAIQRLLKTECKTYKELGTHQGGTAAAALMMKPTRIELVDISMDKYRLFAKPLFEKYCTENNIELTVKEVDSTSLSSLGPEVDLMLIDSRHTRTHMEAELNMHHRNVKKYIVFHDTTAVPQLYQGIVNFCSRNPWEIVERGTANVGYTVIKRK